MIAGFQLEVVAPEPGAPGDQVGAADLATRAVAPDGKSFCDFSDLDLEAQAVAASRLSGPCTYLLLPSGGRSRLSPDLERAAVTSTTQLIASRGAGRLAAGARADVVILNLRTTRYGPVRDPINALVEYGSGADVETVIVDGEVVVENGRSTRIDDDELFAQAQTGANHAWDNWAARDWNGRTVEEIIPPAFPT